jgi:hypothetical protein
VALSGCLQASSQAPAYPAPLIGASRTHVVRGEYSAVALASVDGVSVRDGKLILRGPLGTLSIAPPASADLSKPTRHWALTTESNAGSKRELTFTHAQSIEDFTIEMPAGSGEVLYGVFEATAGTEVMVLAWGAETESYWGYVTVARR